MKAIINNKNYATCITIEDGKVTRRDLTGSPITNVYTLLTSAIEDSVKGDVLYVSRFLYKTIKDKDYEFWLGGTFKNGEALSSEEMDAIIAFNMVDKSGIGVKNIDEYTTADIPNLPHDVAELLKEVVTARTDWNKGNTKTEEKEFIAPANVVSVLTEETKNKLIGMTIKEEEDKDMDFIKKLTGEAKASRVLEKPLYEVLAAIDDDEEEECEMPVAVQPVVVHVQAIPVVEPVKIEVTEVKTAPITAVFAMIDDEEEEEEENIEIANIKPEPVTISVSEPVLKITVRDTQKVQVQAESVKIDLDAFKPSVKSLDTVTINVSSAVVKDSNVVTINLDKPVAKTVPVLNTLNVGAINTTPVAGSVQIVLDSDDTPNVITNPYTDVHITPSATLQVGPSSPSASLQSATVTSGFKVEVVNATPAPAPVTKSSSVVSDVLLSMVARRNASRR